MQTIDTDQFPTYTHLFEPKDANVSAVKNLEAQWVQIQELYESAKLGHERPLDEAHWVRLADRILSPETKTQASLLQLHDIRQQSLEQTLLPMYAGQPIVKKADLALGFDSKHASDGDIIENITSTRTEPLSQMSDSYTSTIPLPCGVEIKMSGGDHNEGVTQLAIWCAAGLARLLQLSDLADVDLDTSGVGSSATRLGPSTVEASGLRRSELLPLVGWVVVGHEWRFYVSWKEQSGDMVSYLAVKTYCVLLTDLLH